MDVDEKTTKTIPETASLLIDYVIESLEGKIPFRETQGRLPSHYYLLFLELLPVLWRIILYLRELQQTQAQHSSEFGRLREVLFQAFDVFYRSCPPKSPVKKACIEFIGNFVMNGGDFSSENLLSNKERDMTFQWIRELPKLLWQLQNNNPSSSATILKLLLRLGSKSQRCLSLTKTQHIEDQKIQNHSGAELTNMWQFFNSLQLAMVPFFCTTISKQPNDDERIFGPFIKLPSDVQRLAIEVVYYYSPLSLQLQRALVACCCEPSVDLSVARYALQVLHYPIHFATISEYLSFLLSIVCYPYWESEVSYDKSLHNKMADIKSQQTEVVSTNDRSSSNNENTNSKEIGLPNESIVTRPLFVRIRELALIVAWQMHSLHIGPPLLDALAPCLIQNLKLFKVRSAVALHFSILTTFAELYRFFRLDDKNNFVTTNPLLQKALAQGIIHVFRGVCHREEVLTFDDPPISTLLTNNPTLLDELLDTLLVCLKEQQEQTEFLKELLKILTNVKNPSLQQILISNKKFEVLRTSCTEHASLNIAISQ